jgi:signal peptidase
MAKRKLGKAAERARAERRRKRQFRAQAIGFVKDIIVAMLIVVIVMASLYAYSGGIWPPMVVVESESMQHGTDSHIGTIDTGDLTLVKKISSRSDIVTYVEGRPSYNVSYEEATAGGVVTKAETFKGAHAGFSNYGDYGEVIIYNKNGRTDETPVIHRAMVWFEPNTTPECMAKIPMGYDGGGDFPDIKNANHPHGLKCIVELTIQKVGYKNDALIIRVNTIVSNAKKIEGKPFAGFLTHGDHNGAGNGQFYCDQENLSDYHTGRTLAPNKVDWIVGKAVGELPWFGALKLVASKTTPTEKIPPSSWKGLITTIVLIIVIPFIVDIAVAQYQKRKPKNDEKKSDEKEDDQEDEEEEAEEENAPKDDKEDDEVVEDVDLDDEYGDEFKEMAASKPDKPSKKNRR